MKERYEFTIILKNGCLVSYVKDTSRSNATMNRIIESRETKGLFEDMSENKGKVAVDGAEIVAAVCHLAE